MDSGLIKKALCFHGKPMQKIWDDERGAGDLQMLGVPEDGNYNVYMDRQKYFTFQDRAKRLKLHQFLARKAVDLFDKDLSKSQMQSLKSKEDIEKAKQYVADVPPYELFIVKNQEKVKRHILESIKPGDIIYATVHRSKFPSTKSTLKIPVTPVCTADPCCKFLNDYKLKAQVAPQFYESLVPEKSGKSRGNDGLEYLRCEVIEFSIDADRLTLSLLQTTAKNKNIKLGFIPYEDMPQLYRKLSEKSLDKYEECVRKSKEFENPNYEVLYTLNGLDINDNFSLMTNLKYNFPPQEYAKELRQVQASKWAFRSVAEGIEYFKVGQHVEAFQCLNKALNIDPRNVEGLVARGALYANKGSFLKAVEDFEKALKLNAYHVNARKYMGETLVALGRSYEEDNRIQDAAKAYRNCLNIIPNHEQARLSLEAIQYRTGATAEPLTPSEVPPAPSISNENILQQQLHDFENQITTIQSSSNEDSSEDSTGSDTEGSDGRPTRDPSLSPLSKKLVMHRACLETNQRPPQGQHYQTFLPASQKPVANYPVIPNEFKLDDDDTESRVQKLLQKAMKHKKEKKKSKKAKKPKKSKKETKLSKSSSSILGKINFEEAYNLLGGGLQIESALSSNLKMYEKSIKEIRQRQEILHKSTSASTSIPSYSQVQRKRSETPPPPPMKAGVQTPSKYVYKSANFSKKNYTAAPKPPVVEQPKFSFQIKKPVKVDKFGLIRLATPALQNSPTPSPPRPKRLSLSPRSRNRSRSRSRGGSGRKYNSRSRSRSCKRGYNGNRGRAIYRRHRSSSSKSRSRSISSPRYRGRRYHSREKSSGSRSIRRTPSPFVPRGTPSPNSRYRRSRSPRFNRRSPSDRRYSRSPKRKFPAPKFGNRSWRRPDFKPRVAPTEPSSSEGKWLHDKFEDKNDGPSIEEIDEIIIKAQKERKQDIINRDKNILKKN